MLVTTNFGAIYRWMDGINYGYKQWHQKFYVIAIKIVIKT